MYKNLKDWTGSENGYISTNFKKGESQELCDDLAIVALDEGFVESIESESVKVEVEVEVEDDKAAKKAFADDAKKKRSKKK